MKHALRVRDLMTPRVAVVRDSDPIDLAEVGMKLARCHHLPVVDDDGRIVGILSDRDVRAVRTAGTVLAGSLMRRDVVTIGPNAPAAHAADLLVEHAIGCLPVVNANQTPVGILSATDFVAIARRALKGKRPRARKHDRTTV